MKKKRPFLLLVLLQGLVLASFAQAKYTVSGVIHAKRTGESVIRATVLVAGGSAGVTTNEYGYFSLTLPAGDYSLVISAVGMQSQTIAVQLRKNLTLPVTLEDAAAELKEVVVS